MILIKEMERYSYGLLKKVEPVDRIRNKKIVRKELEKEICINSMYSKKGEGAYDYRESGQTIDSLC